MLHRSHLVSFKTSKALQDRGGENTEDYMGPGMVQALTEIDTRRHHGDILTPFMNHHTTGNMFRNLIK